MTRRRRLDVGLDDIRQLYAGSGGLMWEMLMGEQIHVGGPRDTTSLARLASITASTVVLDVGSALGGPARQLAATTGCTVFGLDVTPRMHEEARQRTGAAGLGGKVRFKLGDALDIPFDRETFDVVWGQEAWCYVPEKQALLNECARVLKPGGVLAFTDWMETGPMDDDVWTSLHAFMVFPCMETLAGYVSLVESAGLVVQRCDDLSLDFARRMQRYLDRLNMVHRPTIIDSFGLEVFDAAAAGIGLWRDASAASQVGRGRLIARKPSA